jgi:hypothetical protein
MHVHVRTRDTAVIGEDSAQASRGASCLLSEQGFATREFRLVPADGPAETCSDR